MDKQAHKFLGVSVVAVLFLFALASFWYVSAYSRSIQPTRIFSVSAEGEVVAVPDVATFTFSVITEGDLDLGDLQEVNAEKMNGAIGFVKEVGEVDDKDIKTQSYRISPRYQYHRCGLSDDGGSCPPPEIVGYTISQNVLVKVRNFSKIGTLLSGVVREGANSVSGLSFTIDDPTELRAQAREIAMDKAKEKAKSVARSAGFRVGKLVSVNESAPSFYQPIYFAEKAMVAGRGDVAPSVEPGSEEVKVSVTLTYGIK